MHSLPRVSQSCTDGLHTCMRVTYAPTRFVRTRIAVEFASRTRLIDIPNSSMPRSIGMTIGMRFGNERVSTSREMLTRRKIDTAGIKVGSSFQEQLVCSGNGISNWMVDKMWMKISQYRLEFIRVSKTF